MADSRLTFDIFARDRASATFGKVAASSELLKKNLDDVNSSGLGLAKLAFAPSLLPTLAVAGASTLSLATALGSAAGAGGIFGIAVGGTVAQMVKSHQAITQAQQKLAGLTKGSKDYAAALSDLHTKQDAYNKQFGPAAQGMSNVSAAWQKFLDKTHSTTTTVIGKTLNLLATILPKLAPVANAAGRAIGGLVDDLASWAKSPAFDRLIHFFATSGAANITRFGHIIGNVFVGIGGILKNFIGPGDHAAATVERLSRKFAVWANSKGVSDSVQKFLNYASANGGKVASVLASLAAILPKLVSSFSGIGSLSLTAASDFLHVIAALPPGVFRVIADSMFTMALAMKAIAVYKALAGIITAIAASETGLAISMAIGAAATGDAAGAMAGLSLAMDANPIGIVVLAIAALVAGLIYAYKHSETFRKIVQGAFKAVGAACSFMWNGVIKPVFRFLINAWLTVAGAIINGAAKAFGWVPGIGPKLRQAAAWFNDFKVKVNNQLGGIKDRNPKVTAHTHGKGEVDALGNSVSRLHNKDIYVTGHVNGAAAFNVAQGFLPRHARGTDYAPGGWSLVGEEGPELVNMPRGSHVIPTARSARMMSGGDGGIHITINGALDPTSTAKQVQQILLQYKRQLGGRNLGLS